MIRATIVLLAAHAIVPRLRRVSAAERHLIWAAAVAVAATLPALAVVLPPWRPLWASRLAEGLPSLATLPSWALQGSPDVVLRATQVESSPWTNVEWVGAIWVLGSLVALLRLGVEVVKLRRLLATSRPVTDSDSLRVLRETAHALGVGCPPRLLTSPDAVIPLTWGIRRPQVLLPEAACEWQEERLRAVLGHELAHIRRADWLVHVLVQVACAAYWFHPLFWMAERALCRESEHAADDEVLQLGFDGSAYAAQLLAIVRAARTSLPARKTVVAMARTSHLERRVSALLNASANRRSRSRRAVSAAWAIAFVTT